MYREQFRFDAGAASLGAVRVPTGQVKFHGCYPPQQWQADVTLAAFGGARNFIGRT